MKARGFLKRCHESKGGKNRRIFFSFLQTKGPTEPLAGSPKLVTIDLLAMLWSSLDISRGQYGSCRNPFHCHFKLSRPQKLPVCIVLYPWLLPRWKAWWSQRRRGPRPAARPLHLSSLKLPAGHQGQGSGRWARFLFWRIILPCDNCILPMITV